MADIINRLNVGQIVNVKLTDSAITNGKNLVDAYNYAKTLTPNSQALSATNRVALIIMPGNYSLSAELVIDTQFIDIIGIGAQKLNRGSIPAVNIIGNTLNATANNIKIQGISVGTQEFKIGGNLPLQIFEDCTGGDNSFGGFGTASGTFINCTGTFLSFGGFGTASGTFKDCVGGSYSFGGLVDATGIFINCIAGLSSFGGQGNASGTFKDCVGGDYAFGGTGIASGTFIDCTSTTWSFGASNAITGTFINCTGGDNSFSGALIYGKLYQCRLTAGTFSSVSGGGLLRNCIDGNNNIIDQ